MLSNLSIFTEIEMINNNLFSKIRPKPVKTCFSTTRRKIFTFRSKLFRLVVKNAKNGRNRAKTASVGLENRAERRIFDARVMKKYIEFLGISYICF